MVDKKNRNSSEDAAAEIAEDYPECFLSLVSCYYALSEDLLAEYSEVWDWKRLSRNRKIDWSEDLISRYEDRWTWQAGLAINPELPWSEDLIRQFEERWKYHLAWNQGIPCSKELIDRCADLFDWSDLPEQSSIDWSEELIEQHEDRFYWGKFSGSDNEKLPWSKEFIARYEEKWNWDRRGLTSNRALP